MAFARRGDMGSSDFDADALRFFNDLSGTLDIRLSEPAQPISPGMLNLAASPTARIESVSFAMRVFVDLETDEFRELTESEWSRVVLRSPVIRMCGEDGEAVEHRAPDGTAFTVRDLAAAIAETERQTRGR